MTQVRRDTTDSASYPPAAARLLAEWVSFAIAALVIAALAGYLIYNGVRGASPVVPLHVMVHRHRAAPAGADEGRFVVPIEVQNAGRRTLMDVKVRVELPPDANAPPAPPTSWDFDIDYLPEGSRETIYVYLDALAHADKLEARVAQYRLE